MPPAPEEHSLEPGQMLAHYRLIERLRVGADVWRAEDTKLPRSVTIRILRRASRDAGLRKRFHKGARRLAALVDARILRIMTSVATETSTTS